MASSVCSAACKCKGNQHILLLYACCSSRRLSQWWHQTKRSRAMAPRPSCLQLLSRAQSHWPSGQSSCCLSTNSKIISTDSSRAANVRFLCNIGLVIMNKYLITIMGFKFPLTLTCIHMLTCWMGSYMLLKVLNVRGFKFQPISSERHNKQILPLA